MKNTTIRMATAADLPALGRLAQLDSAPPPAPGPALVAEVDGELRAALLLDGRRAIADPFRRTAELVRMLRTAAEQLESRSQGRLDRRSAPIRLLRTASVPGA